MVTSLNSQHTLALATYLAAFCKAENDKGAAGWQAANELVWTLQYYLGIQGHWQTRAGLLELGVTATEAIGHKKVMGSHLMHLGFTFSDFGQIKQAIPYFEKSLAIDRELGDKNKKVASIGNLSNAFADFGDLGTAVFFHTQALAIAKEIGDDSSEAHHAWNLGELLLESNPQQAIKLMMICVEFEQSIGHPDAEADAATVSELKRKYHDTHG